jgi:hypothetical protein
MGSSLTRAKVKVVWKRLKHKGPSSPKARAIWSIEKKPFLRQAFFMVTTKVDDQKRIVVPQAKPGQVYAVQENLDGSFTLKVVSPATPPPPTCRVAIEDGFPVAVPNQPIDEQAIKELLADFP